MKYLPTGTTLVLPGVNLVLDFLDRAEQFAEGKGCEIFKEALAYRPKAKGSYLGINQNSVADLAVAIYRDLLRSTSQWAQCAGTTECTDEQIHRLVKDWGRNVGLKQEALFWDAVVKDLWESIHDWVVAFDSNEPGWFVWYVKRLGLDIVVEKGPDYRILDWERRMRAGYDAKKAQDEGETLPPEAWLPDDEALRFVELLSSQRLHATAGEKNHHRPQVESSIKPHRRKRTPSL